jgi:FkbM family methyltransferase
MKMTQHRVFSFEPSNETFKRLMNNIRLNSSLNITAIKEGLGDKSNEKLTLRQDKGYGDAERYLFPENEARDIELQNINAIKVEEEICIDTLDNKLFEMGVEKIDFLKIDTEGFEYYILKGATKVLKNSPEIVVLLECTELGTLRSKTTQKDVFKILKDNNLNIFYWNTNLNDFSDDDGIYTAGDVWACKNKKQLP